VEITANMVIMYGFVAAVFKSRPLLAEAVSKRKIDRLRSFPS
jgi:hypothetical protein